MKTVFTLCLALGAAVAQAQPITKEQLLSMARGKVEKQVMLELIARNCVAFQVTPDVAVELTPHVPADVIHAAITCTRRDAAIQLPAEPPAPRQVPSSPPPPVDPWRRYYVNPDQLLVDSGFDANDLTCGSTGATDTTCDVKTDSRTWRRVVPARGDIDPDLFTMMFKDDRLIAILHLLSFEKVGDAQKIYAAARVGAGGAFNRPAEELGFVRRRLASALIPGMALKSGASWQTDEVSAAMMMLEAKGGGAVMLVYGEKEK